MAGGGGHCGITDLYILTKRIAEPDWIYCQQHTIPCRPPQSIQQPWAHLSVYNTPIFQKSLPFQTTIIQTMQPGCKPLGMVIMVATGACVAGAAEARRYHRLHMEVAQRLCTGTVVRLTSLPDTGSHKYNNKFLGVCKRDWRHLCNIFTSEYLFFHIFLNYHIARVIQEGISLLHAK